MANNASDINTNSICMDAIDEIRVPAKGDGALLPGAACTKITNTGVIDGAQAGTVNQFIGLLEKHFSKTIDTAPATTDVVDLIVPQQAHKYLVRIDSGNTAAGIAGKPLELSAETTGEFMDAADLGDKVMCKLFQDYNGTDDFAIVTWGAA